MITNFFFISSVLIIELINFGSCGVSGSESGIQELLGGLKVSGTREWGGDETDLLPSWANLTLAIRGQQFAMDHFISVGFTSFYGLTLLLAFPQITDILIFSGNSDTSQKSSRRYGSTMLQIVLWMRRALSPRDNWVLRSYTNVRHIHNNIALKAKLALDSKAFSTILEHRIRNNKGRLNEAFWSAFEADLHMSNVPLEMRQVPQELLWESGNNLTHPMSQFALSMTQWAFFGLIILRPESVLLTNINDDDLLAFCHFWAINGYAMGLQNEFNILLNPSLNSVRVLVHQIFNKFIVPLLFNLGDGSKILLQAFMDGIPELTLGIVEPEFLMRGILRDILGTETPHLDSRRSVLGLKLDILMTGAKLISTQPQWDRDLSPISSLYHFHIGFKYFGWMYSSDENIAKFCYYY